MYDIADELIIYIFMILMFEIVYKVGFKLILIVYILFMPNIYVN